MGVAYRPETTPEVIAAEGGIYPPTGRSLRRSATRPRSTARTRRTNLPDFSPDPVVSGSRQVAE